MFIPITSLGVSPSAVGISSLTTQFVAQVSINALMLIDAGMGFPSFLYCSSDCLGIRNCTSTVGPSTCKLEEGIVIEGIYPPIFIRLDV